MYNCIYDTSVAAVPLCTGDELEERYQYNNNSFIEGEAYASVESSSSVRE